MRKCPATRETNHLFKLNFTLEYYESDLSKVSIKFLGFVFPLNWVSFFRFWPKIRYQFSHVSSLNRARIWDPGRYTPSTHQSSEYKRTEQFFKLFYRLGLVFPLSFRLENSVRLLSYAKPILRKKPTFRHYIILVSRCPRMLLELGFISDRFVSSC